MRVYPSLVALSLAATCLAGCGKLKDQGSSSSAAATDANAVMNEVQRDLQAVSVGYYDHGFSTDQKVLEPCEPHRLDVLDRNATRMRKLGASLSAKEEVARRDVEQRLETLRPLNEELRSYCAEDAEKVNRCLEPAGRIYVSLNRKVRDEPLVNPIVVPFAPREVMGRGPVEAGIDHAYSPTSVGLRAVWKDHSSYDSDNDDRTLFREGRARLSELSRCVGAAGLRSTTGRRIAEYLAAAVQTDF